MRLTSDNFKYPKDSVTSVTRTQDLFGPFGWRSEQGPLFEDSRHLEKEVDGFPISHKNVYHTPREFPPYRVRVGSQIDRDRGVIGRYPEQPRVIL